jgi:hypothetical protein
MTTQMPDPEHFAPRARQIRTQVSTVLKKWGLPPRFKRWRLAQDPGTGMVVLFGVLNDTYIAAHTSIPFRDYFDPRVLHDLANELQVQVVSCSSDGLRYAFILDRARLAKVPTHIDFPFMEEGKLLVRVAYSEPPAALSAPPVEVAALDDHTLVRQGVGAFLKVFDDIKVRDDAASQLSAQDSPAIVLIDKDEFNNRVAAHEARSRKTNPGLPPTNESEGVRHEYN